MEKSVKNKETDLSLTMQQKFNFDSKKIEDELENGKKLYRRKNEIIKLKKELLILEKSKNKYKVVVLLLIILLFFMSTLSFIYIYKYETFEPKTITKKVVKTLGDENIVFVGDSITYQYNLEKYYKDEIHVVNSGIDGNTVNDILDNSYERIYRYNPTKVFLLIGTNDVPYRDEYVIEECIKKLVTNIKKNRPNCDIYLESIYPVNDTDNEKISHSMVHGRKNEKIISINKTLKKFADKTENVTYINMYDKLIDEDGNMKLEYTREGLHLSDEGYKVVTKELSKYINNQ